MINKVKTFFKDFVEIYKVYGRFLRKHWFGYIILTALVIVAELVYFFYPDIKKWIQDKLETKFEKQKVKSNE